MISRRKGRRFLLMTVSYTLSLVSALLPSGCCPFLSRQTKGFAAAFKGSSPRASCSPIPQSSPPPTTYTLPHVMKSTSPSSRRSKARFHRTGNILFPLSTIPISQTRLTHHIKSDASQGYLRANSSSLNSPPPHCALTKLSKCFRHLFGLSAVTPSMHCSPIFTNAVKEPPDVALPATPAPNGYGPVPGLQRVTGSQAIAIASLATASDAVWCVQVMRVA
jgi:hypothetical protein